MLILHENYDQFDVVSSQQPLVFLPDGNGGVFIGGYFSNPVGGHLSRNVVHLLPNGKVDTGFVSPFTTTATVYTLALYGNELFIGGSFSTSSGAPFQRLFSVNSSTGLPTSRNLQVVGSVVYDLKIADNLLYVGGSYTSLAGSGRSYLGAVDLTTDLATAWDPQPDDSVKSLTIDGTTLYIAGGFSTINSGATARLRFAAFDMTTGLVTAFDPQVTIAAFITGDQIKINNGLAYILGGFTQIHGNAITDLGVVDAVTGAYVPGFSQLGFTGYLFDIDVNTAENRVYVSGIFTLTGPSAFNHFCALNGTTGSVLTEVDAGFAAAFNYVLSLYAVGNTLYVGSTSNGIPVSVLGKQRWGPVVFTDTYAPDITPDVPMSPKINLLVRENDGTVLSWVSVTRDVDQNDAELQGYRIYRSNSPNLESFDQIAEITDVGANGDIRTVFAETVVGFYAYAVTAFNQSGESEKSVITAVNNVR